MEKTFTEIFAELADEADKTSAKRIARTLEANGITSMQHLLGVTDEKLYSIKGIGNYAMRVIGVIKTREEARLKKMMNEYKKAKGKKVNRDIRYYAQQAGMNYLSACQFERIMTRYNVRTPQELLDCPQEVLSQFKGIGAKRLQQCIDIKSVINADRKRNTK